MKMKKHYRSIDTHFWWVLVPLMALALLVACRGQAPNLVIPTPPLATDVSPTAVPTELSVVTPTALPATTQTLAPTAVPTFLASATPAPTAAPPVATPAPVGDSDADTVYRVAFVAANDVLNVRRQPNPNAAVVAQLAPDATGIAVLDEGQAVTGGSLWLPVETTEGDGWVNSAFLTEAVDREAFCSDAAVDDLLARLQKAVAEKDGDLLSELVHHERGLRLRLNWWNEEILVRGDELAGLFDATTSYDWGFEDGSGLPIRGSFRDVALPRLEQDLLGADEWTCDEGRFGPTAGSTVLPEGYEAVRFVSAHRTAPIEMEMDWGTWLIGVERWQGRYYISYMVHYRWEI